MRTIDLTLPLHPAAPVYPGDDPTEFQRRLAIEREGYLTHRICLGTHAGTHVDAPAHRIVGGMTVDHLSVLDACVGEAVLRDVTGAKHREIVQDDMKERAGACPRGGRLILRTGWSSRYGTSGYYRGHPVLSRELAELIVQSGVRLVGIDTPSVEDDSTGVEVHTLLLGAGIIIVEGLGNLELVPEGRFFLSVAPLRLAGLDGSPARAYARIP
jgi:kynurenine formamidase